ncbi:uncharacterized protein OCT59_024471 [Rhizophagus irregularis]|uniref:uncharacterized protein n=1 Tax=Rhizophagus irregularis TaxID=588596 RepID=UPI000CBFBA33|nr:hypothetical protein OCT59_024471 [Rhizophagus irregularis]
MVRLGASKQNVEAFLSVWEIRMTTFETVQAGNFKHEELRNSGFQTVQVGNFEVINLKWFKCFGSVLRK